MDKRSMDKSKKILCALAAAGIFFILATTSVFPDPGVGMAAPIAAMPGAVLQAHPAPPAKSVIQIWMWGGPSHLDTFDPKPEAGRDYAGPLDSPIATNVPGITIGQQFPLLAGMADKYSIVRSMTHGSNAHETAAYMMQTGREPGGGLVYPSLGAIVSYFKGYRAGYTGKIPPYVVLTESQGRFSEEGFLGPAYKPFVTGGDPNAKVFAVEGVIAEGITPERQDSRRALMDSLDGLGKSLPGAAPFSKAEQLETEAYELILGQAKEVFDLSSEPAALRDRYGRTSF
ncbi:MAG TPA: DUF1501 domain-containing protein, partial [Rectinemataceae bacterium]